MTTILLFGAVALIAFAVAVAEFRANERRPAPNSSPAENARRQHALLEGLVARNEQRGTREPRALPRLAALDADDDDFTIRPLEGDPEPTGRVA